MGKPEGKIEDYLIAQAKKQGIWCKKFVSPGTSGVPDRILIDAKTGLISFVECKAPGKDLRALQKAVTKQMGRFGAAVYKADTKEAVDAVISSMRNELPLIALRRLLENLSSRTDLEKSLLRDIRRLKHTLEHTKNASCP